MANSNSRKSSLINKMPKVSSRTRILFDKAVGQKRKNECDSNSNGDLDENFIKRRCMDETSLDHSAKPESPLPFGADNLTIQELLQSGILSDSDEDIFDFRKKTSACKNIIPDRASNGYNNNKNQSPISSLITNENDFLLGCGEADKNITHDMNDLNTNGENTPVPSPVNEWLNHKRSHVSQDIVTENEVPLESPYLDSDSIISTPQANSPFAVSTDPPTPASIKRRNCKQRKDKGNVRRRHESEWIDSKRKNNKNLGKDYTSRNGTPRAAKKIGAKCPLTCRMKCHTKISEKQRQHIFDSFWSLGDRNKQWEYLAQFALRQNKRRIYSDTESKRKYTIKYHLPSNAHEELDILQPIEVCKKMFLGTFSVSEQLVYTAIDKKNKSTGICEADRRGKHGNQRRTITNEVKESVCNHVKSLKPVESHYTRKDSDKLYLDGSLNYRRLFELYNEWDGLESYTSKAQTERQYHDIVNDNFKICFHIPKKDQCDQCHVFKNLEAPSTEESDKYNQHILNKTQARQMKSKDKQEAQASNGKIVTASFDFQKILNAPHGEIGILYYKRKLSVFNFTVYSLGQKEGTCFMWQESQGRRGANEVASCLLDFVKKNVEQGTTEFRFWSDNCVGQNRNRIVYIFYVYVALNYKIKVTHSFLEKGHTQAESDSVHAVIEKAAKNKLIYTPSEWYSLVKWSKTDGKPYDVREMDHTDFYDFKLLLKGRNWTKGLKGEKVNWNKIKQIEINADDPFKLHYKYNLGDEYSIISIGSNTRAKNKCVPLSLASLYPNVLPISKPKMDDLMSLCNSGIIPNSHSGFFKALKQTDIEEPIVDSESE